ncbi:hypothetical protein E2K93_13255 [Thalassotalea sp. HSM 43]|uniref:sensor histidine kinase n=1 Tax=Thalassotalea sp. HSM 43 TaxID=2552945 RepID=UPI001082006F|nr:ATP-binding protein [Thalassotalea sp. HSM 43]QBY05283.1 hypothetical protein E2K93_13255 [Thalassotalea sp. HSM 43]
MLKNFIRYYCILLASFFSFIFIADYLYQNESYDNANSMSTLAFQMVDEYCQNYSCQSEQALPFESLSIMPVADIAMSESSSATLNRGDILTVIHNDETAYYFKQINEQTLLRIGPFAADQHNGVHWYTIVFYGIFVILVFVGLYPLFSDMYRLKNASVEFAHSRDLNSLQLSRSKYFQPVNEAFYWMTNKIAKLIALQKDISDTLAHEFNTILSRLNFNVAVLDRDNIDEFKQKLANDVEELSLLVEEHLNFSKQEHQSQTIALAPGYISPIVQEYIEQVEHFSGKEISYQNDADISIDLNERYICRAIKNLIDNAIKYSKQSVRVHQYTTDTHLVLQIDDDGTGVESSDIETLFLPFVRSEKNKHQPGYGLGLAITQKIVFMHKGQIDIERSKVSSGACFKLLLPLN